MDILLTRTMNSEDVTNYMDWLAEHWGWIGALVGVIVKFAQDHIKIKELDEQVKELKDNQIVMQKEIAVIETKLDAISSNTEAILNKMKEYDDNVVNFWKEYDVKPRKD